jgi:hypothetical protein
MLGLLAQPVTAIEPARATAKNDFRILFLP